MKNYLYLTCLGFLFFSPGQFANLVAQTLNIETTVTSDHPLWSTDQPLPASSGSTLDLIFVESEITNTSTQFFDEVINITYPEHFTQTVAIEATINGSDIGIISVTNILDNSIDISFASGMGIDENETLIVTFALRLVCPAAQNPLLAPNIITYSIPPPTELNVVGGAFQIALSSMLITGFEDHLGNPLPQTTDLQRLIIGHEDAFRKYDLVVTNGFVYDFRLTRSEVDEITFVEYQLTLFDEDDIVISTTVVNQPEISTLSPNMSLNDLFGVDYLKTYDRIEVKEYFDVVECSVIGDNTGTLFELEWSCSMNFDNIVAANRRVSVLAAPTNIQASIGSTNLANGSLIDICGEPTDFWYEFTNPVPQLPFIEGSGGKQIQQVVFPIDFEWFGGTSNLDVYLVSAGGEYDLIEDPLNLNIFTINENNNTCILNLQNAQQEEIPPFVSLYGVDGLFLEEGNWFRIEFRGLSFDCQGGTMNGVAQIENQAIPLSGQFGDCEKGNRMPFGQGGGEVIVTYRDMCHAVAPVSNQTTFQSLANFSNSYSMTIIPDDPPTDLFLSSLNPPTPGTDVANIQFQYNTTSGVGSSPFDFTAPSPNDIQLFNCGEVHYQAILKIPDLLALHEETLKYFADPAGTGQEVSLSITETLPIEPYEENGVQTHYNVYRIAHEAMGPAGVIMYDATLQTDPVHELCTVEPFNGTLIVSIEIQAICGDCTDCPYTVGCEDSFPIVYHCPEPCSSIIGTAEDSFEADRITMGWESDEMIDLVDGTSPGVRLDRVYPCDIVQVSAPGEVGIFNYDELFFQINFEHDEADFEFYNIFAMNSGSIHFEDPSNGTNSFTYNFNPSDFEEVELGAENCTLRFHVDEAAIQALQAFGATAEVTFNAELRVQDMPTLMAFPKRDFYFNLRGQFAAVLESETIYSCDHWGAAMNFIKANASRVEPDGILCPGNILNNGNGLAGIGYNAVGICNRSFLFGTVMFGGLPGFDDFPGEFRPIMMWPEGTSLTVPTGVTLSTNYARNFRLLGESWGPMEVNDSGGAISFEGITGGDDWPILDQNGSFQVIDQYTMGFHARSMLHYYHPPGAGANPPGYTDAVFTFPWLNRGYSVVDIDGNVVPDEECVNLGGDPDEYNHPKTDFSFLLLSEAANNQVVFNASTGIIEGFSLIYTHEESECNTLTPTQIERAWLRDDSDGLTINRIIPVNSLGEPQGPEIEPDNGYFHIGHINRSLNNFPTYYFNVEYTIDNCDELEVKLGYGFICNEYEDTPWHLCHDDELTLEHELVNTNLFIATIPDSDNALYESPCDTYGFQVGLLNYNLGFISDLILSIEMHPDINISAASYSFLSGVGGGTLTIPQPEDCDSESCTTNFDLSDLFENVLMPGYSINNLMENPVLIHIEIQGTCGMHGDYPITFSADGLDLCSESVSPLIYNQGFQHILHFPDGAEIGENCPEECYPLGNDYCFHIVNEGLDDKGVSIVSTNDGGYAVAGNMLESGNNPDFYLATFDEEVENILGMRIGEGPLNPRVDLVHSSLFHENQLYLVGESRVLESDETQVFLACINPDNGTLIWGRRYWHNIGEQICVGMTVNPFNNRLLVTGNITRVGGDNTWSIFALLVQTGNGSLSQSRIFTSQDGASIRNTDAIVVEDSMGDHAVITGYRERVTNEMIAFQLNSSMISPNNYLSIDLFNNSQVNIPSGIVQVGDFYYLAGTSNFQNNRNHIYVVELDAANFSTTGETMLLEYEPGSGNASKITQSEDGNILVVGTVHNIIDDREYGVLSELLINHGESNHLTPVWSSISIDSEVQFNDVTTNSSEQIIISGTIRPEGSADEIFVVSADKTGQSCCMIPIEYNLSSPLIDTNRNLRQDNANFTRAQYSTTIDQFDSEFICPSWKSFEFVSLPTANEPGFKLFPNPNSGSFTIELTEKEDVLKSVTIFDLSGRMFTSSEISGIKNGNTQMEVSGSNMVSGMYIVRIESTMGTWTTRLSVVK